MKIAVSDTVKYIGVNDREIDLFEGQYIVPNGMAYNSYVVFDEKIAVIDSVDARFSGIWLENIAEELKGASPDYLVVHHMEPDHSGSIRAFMSAYPQTKIVASARAFVMMKNFYGEDYSSRRVVVGDGDSLSLGGRSLSFFTAPMVHWPEVILSYDSAEGILFSADAFGKFGALDADEDWACEARRYYIGIVGKYGGALQSVFAKLGGLNIQIICPLHGPVLTENLEYYFRLYNIWSTYAVEEDGIVIAYTSVYGNTKKAVELLAEELEKNGCRKVVVNDLARCDMAEAVEDAFRYGKLVLATTTYNGGIFPYMREFIEHLTERNFSNREVAFIENGSWAPTASRIMKSMLEKSKNLSYTAAGVRIMSALNEESTAQLMALAAELNRECPAEQPEEIAGKKFICKICGYIHEGEELPSDFECPICRQSAEFFEEVK